MVWHNSCSILLRLKQANMENLNINFPMRAYYDYEETIKNLVDTFRNYPAKNVSKHRKGEEQKKKEIARRRKKNKRR